MRLVSLTALTSLLFVVSACGAVKFPGIDKKEQAERTRTSPEKAVAPIPISDPQSDSSSSLQPISGDIDVAGPPTGLPTLPTFSLSEINAMTCGQASAPDTNTLAEIMEATLSETVQPQAVNARAVSMLEDFPGIVKLEPKRNETDNRIISGHCGATRIADNWFVTAAHCVDQSYDRIELIVGTADLQSPAARKIEADAVICHGGYTGQTGRYANDIALLHIPDAQLSQLSETPVSQLEATSTALTPSQYPIVHMAGWGLTGFEQELSSMLQTTDLTLVGSGPATIIVESQNGSGPCIGDSGGPLFVTEPSGTRTLIGVLSVIEAGAESGSYCEGDYKARYTNTAGFIDWIQDVMLYCSVEFDACARQ
ncbi:MAG: trypsin-like serine protease [Pseudomonadota bacterium]